MASAVTPTRRGRIVKVAIDADSSEPLYRQVYASVRADIVQGNLTRGATLPSTRQLALDIGVARCTIVQAYDQLRAEGYVESVPGAGTRVSPVLPDDFLRRTKPEAVPDELAAFKGQPSRRGQAILSSPRRVQWTLGRPPRAFRAGVPAVDVFPMDTWGRMLSRRWQRMTSRMLAYSEPAGYPPLRQVVADYLRGARGVRCSPEQVFIVSGAQQALDLCARVLLDPGDRVWLEDPGYHGARGAFVGAGAEIVPVPVDREGLVVAEGERMAPDARLAFVTPSRQLPLGVTMSTERRRELLSWAQDASAWIIEDDYDSEFRYATRPLPSLQGLDTHGCVVYVGTFSKVMFPSLRLGYVVVPESLTDVFAAARHFADYHSPLLEQAVLAEFIMDGHFERHIRRMRTLYRTRQDVLLEAAQAHLAGLMGVQRSDAGISAIGVLENIDDVAASRAADRAGIDTVPMSWFAIRHHPAPALLLGYAGVRESELRDGVARLAVVLESLARRA